MAEMLVYIMCILFREFRDSGQSSCLWLFSWEENLLSEELPGYVRHLKLGRPEKEILRNMCVIAGDIPGKLIGTDCFPSIDWLSWVSDYSERQVQISMRKLEAMGVVVPIRVHPELKTTEYEIHLYRAPKKEPFVPKKRRGPGRDFSKIKGATLAPNRENRVQPLHPTPQPLHPSGCTDFTLGCTDFTVQGEGVAPHPAATAPDFVFISPVKENPPVVPPEGGPATIPFSERSKRRGNRESAEERKIRRTEEASLELLRRMDEKTGSGVPTGD